VSHASCILYLKDWFQHKLPSDSVFPVELQTDRDSKNRYIVTYSKSDPRNLEVRLINYKPASQDYELSKSPTLTLPPRTDVPDLFNQGQFQPIDSVAISPPSPSMNHRLAIATVGGRIEIYDLATGRQLQEIQTLAKEPITQMAYSPDGSQLLTIVGKKARIFNPLTGQKSVSLIYDPAGSAVGESHPDSILVAQWLPDSKTVLTGDARNVFFWKVPPADAIPENTFVPVLAHLKQRSKGKDNGLAVVSRYGGTVAISQQDGRIELRVTRTGALKQTLQMHKAPLVSLDFSLRDDRLLSADSNGHTYVWDLKDPKIPRLATIPNYKDAPVVQAFFVNYAKRALVAYADGVVRLWNVNEVSQYPQLRAQLLAEYHGDSNNLVSISYMTRDQFVTLSKDGHGQVGLIPEP
jgi:WD40 repeat protein